MTKQIPLTQGKFAIVDDADFDKLNKFKWCAHADGNKFYAQRGRSRLLGSGYIQMHAEIMQTPNGMTTDHIDGDGLNNRRTNLRVVTHSHNAMNRGKTKTNKSGYKGVSWKKDTKKWRAQIMLDGKVEHLGYHHTPEDAARAYDKAAREFHGEFAFTNFDD